MTSLDVRNTFAVTARCSKHLFDFSYPPKLGCLRQPFFCINNSMATLTKNINYLQPTSYKLVLDRKNYPNLEFFAQTINHPGIGVNSAEVPFRKIASVPFAGDSLTFGALTANVILDEDMKGYTEMYDWIRRLVDEPSVRATQRTDTVIPHYADITLSLLSSHNNTVKKVRYYECVPIGLGDVQFGSAISGNEFITFPISFRFTYFELE